MQPQEPLLPGKYYHIYNRGIDGCNLFMDNENYIYFLKRLNKFISPVANIFAYVLMPNHFHFLVMIREAGDINPVRVEDQSINPVRVEDQSINPVRVCNPQSTNPDRVENQSTNPDRVENQEINPDRVANPVRVEK